MSEADLSQLDTTQIVPPDDGPRFNLLNEARFLWRVGRPHHVELFSDGRGPHHVVLMHGWHSTERQMRDWERALQRDCGENCTFWRVTYDTHWKGFQRSARRIIKALRREGVNDGEVTLIGYSMGGIIARQMVAYGFECKNLVALCSPHQGAMGWSPLRVPLLLDPGAATLTQYSRTLKQLNTNKRDRAMRERYHFLALTYRDKRGEHAHDGIVGRDSALGTRLGEIGSRTHVEINYHERNAFFTDPHMLGMSPAALPLMRERIVQLLND